MIEVPDSADDSSRVPLNRTALRYLVRVVNADHPSDEPFVLNGMERRVIRRLKAGATLVSAFLGAAAVWVVYLPHIFWREWFTRTHTALGDWPLVSILFAALVLYLMLHAQIMVHSWAVRLVEIACQFPRQHDAQFGTHLKKLAGNSTQRGMFRPRLTPRPLLPWTMPGYLLTIFILALLSDGLLQLAARIGKGGPLEPYFMVMSSTVVFALWSGLATVSILKQAQVRIMAPLTIRQFVNELCEEFGRDQTFRGQIPGVLQYAAVSLKPDNYPHLLLIESLTARFNLRYEMPTAYLPEQLAACPEHIRQGLERLFIFSILIDGELSSLEGQRLRRLDSAVGLSTPPGEVKAVLRNFLKGDGLWV
ncbi:LBF_2804 family protein [Larkinella soli]|uniref:LBF_2804 family protein n=1 Tax=Larkinella soli TaxID=1770527 RepID=UPI000FFC9AA2|nr:hypothetical protein [Larkinella soli]